MIGIDYGPGVYGRIQAQFQNFDSRTQAYYPLGSSPSIGLRIGARDNYWCEDTVIEDGTLSRNCQIGLFFHNYNGQGSFQGTMIKKFYAATSQPGQVGVKIGYGNGIPVTNVQYLASGSGGNPTGANCLKWTVASGYNVGAAGTLQLSVSKMPYPEYNGVFVPLSYGTGLVTTFYTDLGVNNPVQATSISPTLSGALGEVQNASTFYQSYFNAETVQQYQTPFFGNLSQVYQLGGTNNVTGITQPATNSLYIFPSGGMPATPAVSGSKFYFSVLNAPSTLSGNLGREFTVTNNTGGFYTVTGTTSSAGGVGFTSVTGTMTWGDYQALPGLVYGSGVPSYSTSTKYNSAFAISTPAPASGTATITSGTTGSHVTLTWSGSSNSFYYWQLGCGVYTDSLGLIGYIDPNTNNTSAWNPSVGTISSASIGLLRTVSTNTTDTFYVTNFPDKSISPTTVTTVTGATYGSGVTTITGISTTAFVSGMYLFGTGIRVPTTITAVASGSITISRATGSSASNTTLWVDSYTTPDESPYVLRDFPTVLFTGNTTAGSNAITNVSSVSGLAIGQSITSVQGGLLNGNPSGYVLAATTITAISGASSTVYISSAAVNNGTGVKLFTGYGKTGASHAGTLRNNSSGLNTFAAGTTKTVNVDPFVTDYVASLPTAGATSSAQLFGASIGLQLGSSFTDWTNFTGGRFELTGEDHGCETIGYYLNENFKFDGTGLIDYEYGTPLVQVSQGQAGTIQFLGDVNVRETGFDRSHIFNQTSMFNVANAFGTQYSVGPTPAVNPRARIVGDIQQLGTYYTNYFSVQNLTTGVQHTAQILATQSTRSGIDELQIKNQSNTAFGHNLLRTWYNSATAATSNSGAHYTAQTYNATVFQIDGLGNTTSAGYLTVASGITTSGLVTAVSGITMSGQLKLPAATSVVSGIPGSNTINLNNSTFIFDDGNTHITSSGNTIWLNTNSSADVQVNTQSPSTGGLQVGGRILSVSGTVTGSNLSGDSGWINPTLGNSFSVAGGNTVSYRLLNNVVYLRGALTGGTAGASAFTLPVGYRPAAASNFANQIYGTGTFCYITVNADGTVVPNNSAAWLSSCIFPIN